LPSGVVTTHDQHSVVLAIQRGADGIADDVERAGIVVGPQRTLTWFSKTSILALLPSTTRSPPILLPAHTIGAEEPICTGAALPSTCSVPWTVRSPLIVPSNGPLQGSAAGGADCAVSAAGFFGAGPTN
jgi:hypothetical protein